MSFYLPLSIGYLIGSIPTAFILLRWEKDIDIRNAGSRNVGGMNAFDVTGSKIIGITVIVIDMLKGTAAVLLVYSFIGKDYWLSASSGIAAILGHNYPIWLGFKGGRGISTTAGVFFVLGWIYIAIWIITWAVIHTKSKDDHVSNIVACIVTPIVIAVLPQSIYQATFSIYAGKINYLYLALTLSILIIIRHIESVKQLFKSLG